MKKLMITLSAVAAGLGLYAASATLPTGTSFEQLSVGDNPVTAQEGFWSASADEGAVIAVEAWGTDGYEGDRPDMGQLSGESGTANMLSIKTKLGSPVYRNVDAESGTADMGQVYFDSLVKFTACDEDIVPTNYSDAKLMVWLKEIEGETPSYKMYVTAGQVAEGGAVTAVNYDCGNEYSVTPDNWVRLTIKSIANVAKSGTQVPAFVVFVNGQPLSCDVSRGAGLTLNAMGTYWGTKLFPSAVSGDVAAGTTVSQVGFDGQGKVDELLFTATKPFDAAADKKFFTLTWNPAEFEGGGTISVNDAGVDVTAGSYQYAYDSGSGDVTVTVTATPKAGRGVKQLTTESSGVSIKDTTFTIAAGAAVETEGAIETFLKEKSVLVFDADGNPLEAEIYTFVEACKYFGENAGTYTLQLAEDQTLGVTEDYTDGAIDNAGAVVTIDLHGKTLTSVEGAMDYVLYLNCVATVMDSVGGGKIVAVDGQPGVILTGNGVELTIESGEFDGDIAVGEESSVAAALTITGGTFNGLINGAAEVVAEGGTVSITGGSFIPAEVGEEAFYLKDYVPEDEYEVTKSGDYWVVAKVEKKGWAIYLAGAGTPEAPYQIKDEDDLIELATYMHTAEEFPTEDVVFQLQNDIPMTKPFAGIGVGNAKDLVSWSLTGNDPITPEKANENIAAFNAGAFKGIFDGNGYQITNLQLVWDDSHGDYAGFIQSALGATIKNLTIGVNETSLFSPNDGNRGGAIIAGVTVNTTIENCQTLAGSVTVNKAEAGIVGYACGGTVIKACTNNLAITTSNEKVGGIVACAQKGASKDGKLVFGDGTLVIEDCENAGNLTCLTKDKEFTAGLASYGDTAITFKGLNSNTGTLTCSGNKVYTVCAQKDGSITVADGASFHVQAAYKAVRTACDGFNFGTVNGEWITFVKDADVASGMRVMAADAPVALAADASITLDQTVATPKVTVPNGYYDAITGAGAAVTHTATAKTDYSAAVLALASESADWTDQLKFPYYTVKVGGTDVPTTAYEAVWAPESIAAMAAGDADKVYTLTVTIKDDGKVIVPAAALTKTFTVKAPAAGGDIPTDPEKDITDKTKPTDLGLDADGPFKDAGKAELIKLSKWANTAGKKAADINAGIAFDQAGNPTTEMAEAYLLDCGVDGVEAAKEKFKFNAEDLAAVLADPTSLTTLNGNSYNGTIQVKAFSDAACKTPAEGDLDAKFYKAVLVK